MRNRAASHGRLTALPGGGRGGGGPRPRLRALTGRRRPSSRPGRSRRRLIWVLAALLVAALGFIVYVGRSIGRSGPAQVPVRQGVLELAFDTEALLVRDEFVQVSPVGGPLEKLAEDGRLVRTGSPVARVGGVEVRAERPGVVSYEVDGLEAELTPARLPWLQTNPGGETGAGMAEPATAWLQSLPQRRVQPLAGSVSAGQPLFRAMDPGHLWLLVSLPADQVQGVALRDLPRVTFTALGGTTVRFTVVGKSKAENGQVLLGLQADAAFPEALLHPRRTPIRVVLDRTEGLIVPAAALKVEGERLGVWLIETSGRRFVPVGVAGRSADGSELVVSGELQVGDQVLAPSAGVSNAKSLQQ